MANVTATTDATALENTSFSDEPPAWNITTTTTTTTNQTLSGSPTLNTNITPAFADESSTLSEPLTSDWPSTATTTPPTTGSSSSRSATTWPLLISSSPAATTLAVRRTTVIKLLTTMTTRSGTMLTTAQLPRPPSGTSVQRYQQPVNGSTSKQQHLYSHQYETTTSATRSSTGSNGSGSTGGGLPVALLWLPYAALTLFLTALLVASFVHFHCKNGHKYKRRRSPSNVTISSSLTGNGNSGNWRDPFVDRIADQSLSAVVVQPLTTSPLVGPSSCDVRTAAASSRTASNRTAPRASSLRREIDRDRESGGGGGGGGSGGGAGGRGRSNRRKSVEFVSNRNGSMVNMRWCGTTSLGDAMASWPTSSVAESRQNSRPSASNQNRQRRLSMAPSSFVDVKTPSSMAAAAFVDVKTPSSMAAAAFVDVKTPSSMAAAAFVDVKTPSSMAAAAFRPCTESNPSSTAGSSSRTTARSTKGRVAPVARGWVGGTRVPVTVIDENGSRSGSFDDGVGQRSSLYSAVRICKMDETPEDWNRLLSIGESKH